MPNSAATQTTPLLAVRDVVRHFPIRSGLLRTERGRVRAVDGVSFELRRGETLGIVGESGSGKSTLARLIAALDRPTAGSVIFEGRDVHELGDEELLLLRRDVQMIFQDPFGALNPRMSIRQLIAEPWQIHRDFLPKSAHDDAVKDLLDRVGLPADVMRTYPGELSGGQQQRVGIARALALRPKLIVCDEPVSALDVSVQAQVINLLRDLQREYGMTYIFIGHDLSVVRAISDYIAVMYMGRIVEQGTDDEIYDAPLHPYTQALLSAVPEIQPDEGDSRARIVLPGEIPDPSNPPSGCRFRTRCWKSEEVCKEAYPELIDRSEGSHLTACHFPEQITIEESAR